MKGASSAVFLSFYKFFKPTRLGLKPNKASVSMGFRAKLNPRKSMYWSIIAINTRHCNSSLLTIAD